MNGCLKFWFDDIHEELLRKSSTLSRKEDFQKLEEKTKMGLILITESIGQKTYKYKFSRIPKHIKYPIKNGLELDEKDVYLNHLICPLPTMELLDKVKRCEINYEPVMANFWFEGEWIWPK